MLLSKRIRSADPLERIKNLWRSRLLKTGTGVTLLFVTLSLSSVRFDGDGVGFIDNNTLSRGERQRKKKGERISADALR